MIQYNGLTLAYIGDAYFELAVRQHLLEKNITKVNDLHNNAVGFTNANAQAEAVTYLLNHFFDEEEISVYKRGRNQSSTHKPKNADIQTYNIATGLESVIGFLYLEKRLERLEDLLKTIFKVLEEK
ncbi:MAG TPA: ribonuclease III domain-containing protein [Bacillota bacterium]|nr:ribonuclease III domain-containing protein [Bacillota bacterium]